MSASQEPISTREPVELTAPDGWKWARLNEAAKLESGHTPSRREPGYWGGQVRWLSLKDIRGLDDAFVHETADMPTLEGIANSSARLLPAGTVAFCRTASVGNVVILGREMATSQDFVNWICGEDLDSKYLYWALKNSQRLYAREKTGTTHKTIYMPTVKRFSVLCPPVPEQKRIAAILDKADAIRRKRQQAIALTEDLLRSTFLETFGDPVLNKEEWRTESLGNLLDEIQGGWSPVCETRPATGEEWGILKLGAVTFGRYADGENKALKHDCAPRPELEVRSGDILFSRKNTHEHVAACVLVEETRPRLMLPDLVFRLKIAARAGVTPTYLWAVLSHAGIRSGVQRLASGAAGSMPNISKVRLRGFEVPVPPMDLQMRFRAAVTRIHGLRSKLTGSGSIAEDLFGSLSQRAFRGEL